MLDSFHSVTVSAIVPCHNHGRFLAQAIRSAREQRPAPNEIVVVDDGSTDETQATLAALDGPDLVVLRQQRKGPAAARNRAIRASRSEWLAFLDADSYWLPGKLEALVGAIRAAPAEVALAYSGYLVVDEKGRTIASHRAPPRPYTAHDLRWGNPLSTTSILVRRASVVEAGLFDESLPGLGEDWDMWLRLMSRHRVACVEEPLTARRASRFDAKYRIDELEVAIEHVLARHRAPRRSVSWHRTLLAKNYALRRRPWHAARCTARAVRSHPIALWYLVPHRLSRAAPRERKAEPPGFWT
jgi:glycosyltransferase involved in cell wall biosynthesis